MKTTMKRKQIQNLNPLQSHLFLSNLEGPYFSSRSPNPFHWAFEALTTFFSIFEKRNHSTVLNTSALLTDHNEMDETKVVTTPEWAISGYFGTNTPNVASYRAISKRSLSSVV